MLYNYDGEPLEIDADDVILEDDARESFDEMLDDVYGDAEIAGMTFNTSRALRELDPIAYRCGFLDYLDADYDAVYNGEGMEAGYVRKD